MNVPSDQNGVSSRVNGLSHSEVSTSENLLLDQSDGEFANLPSTSRSLTIRIDEDQDDYDDTFETGEINCQNCRLTMENAMKAHSAVAEMANKIAKFAEMKEELRHVNKMLEDRQTFVIEQKEKLDHAAKREREVLEQLRLAEERSDNFKSQAEFAREEAKTAKELVDRAAENQKKLEELQKVVNDMSSKYEETTLKLYSMAKLAEGLKEERDQLKEKLANRSICSRPVLPESPVKTRRRTLTDNSIVPSVSTDEDTDLEIDLGDLIVEEEKEKSPIEIPPEEFKSPCRPRGGAQGRGRTRTKARMKPPMPFSAVPQRISPSLKGKELPVRTDVSPDIQKLPPLFLDPMPIEIDEIFGCSFLTTFPDFPLIEKIDQEVTERVKSTDEKHKVKTPRRSARRGLKQRLAKAVPYSSR